MDSIKVLGEQFTAKQKERDELLAKGEEIGAADVERATALNRELAEIKGKVEAVQQVSRLRAESGALDQWAGATATTLPGGLPGVPGDGSRGTYGNGVSVLGMQADGEMVIDRSRRGTEVLNFDRQGQPDSAFRVGAFNAIREAEYASSFRRYLSRGLGQLTNNEQATLQEGIDVSGGFLSPDDLLNRVIQRQPTPTRVAGRVMRITTSREAISLPKVNYSTDDLYTTGIRASFTGEVPATATGARVTDPVFGQVRVPVYTAMLSILVTNDLLEDSTVDLMGWLSLKFGETIELLKDNMILNGTGVGQPMGILANPGGTNQPAVIVSGAASTLTGDGLINLTEALPEQYDENAVLVFNKTNTGKAIRLLKDGDGRPLVSYGNQDNGLAAGRYKEVNGYPYIWSGFMPNVGASTYPAIFGDLMGYYLVDRLGFSIQVLNEVYAEVNGKLLLGRVRFGGMTAEEWRLRILQAHV